MKIHLFNLTQYILISILFQPPPLSTLSTQRFYYHHVSVDEMSFPCTSNTRCRDNATSLGISLVLGEPTTIVSGDRYCPTYNRRWHGELCHQQLSEVASKV